MDILDSFKYGNSKLNNHSAMTVGKFILALSDEFKFRFMLTPLVPSFFVLFFFCKQRDVNANRGPRSIRFGNVTSSNLVYAKCGHIQN